MGIVSSLRLKRTRAKTVGLTEQTSGGQAVVYCDIKTF